MKKPKDNELKFTLGLLVVVVLIAAVLAAVLG